MLFRSDEHCKDLGLKFIDAGISYQRGHVQTIYPGESALFDAFVDYEDLSEEAPHCVTKSFPTNIDHCIQWAMRKSASWKKEKPLANEDLLAKAKAKFKKHFNQKPRDLLKTFPMEANAETWKRPKRPPRTDVDLCMTTQLHADLIRTLVSMYEWRQKTEEDDDGELVLPSGLEHDLLLHLTKMRAFIYNIEANLEPDEELVRRALKTQPCQVATAALVSALICLEVQKLEAGLKSNDWWFSQRDGLLILKSMSEPMKRQVGKVELSQWEVLRVAAAAEWTMQDFIDHLHELELTVELVVQNGKILYNKAMPTHNMRKKKA